MCQNVKIYNAQLKLHYLYQLWELNTLISFNTFTKSGYTILLMTVTYKSPAFPALCSSNGCQLEFLYIEKIIIAIGNSGVYIIYPPTEKITLNTHVYCVHVKGDYYTSA